MCVVLSCPARLACCGQHNRDVWCQDMESRHNYVIPDLFWPTHTPWTFAWPNIVTLGTVLSCILKTWPNPCAYAYVNCYVLQEPRPWATSAFCRSALWCISPARQHHDPHLPKGDPNLALSRSWRPPPASSQVMQRATSYSKKEKTCLVLQWLLLRLQRHSQ